MSMKKKVIPGNQATPLPTADDRRRKTAMNDAMSPDVRGIGAQAATQTMTPAVATTAAAATAAAATAAAEDVELAGSIWFRSNQQNWGSQKRMALLAAIKEKGSITAAAKTIGLSYKAAWDAVDTMNNLAGESLVARTTGGQRGGGASLTPRALELLALYDALQREHARFLARLATVTDMSSENLEVIQTMMVQTSARNKLSGIIAQIKPGAVNDEVTLKLSESLSIVASITKESVQTLDLYPGRRALAFIKSSSVMLGLPGEGLRLSARNQLLGHISRMTHGAVNSEVCIRLDAGDYVIAAMISKEGATRLDLQENQAVCALFKASSVMIGVLD
jgi:molybdate transport system regulatory protein